MENDPIRELNQRIYELEAQVKAKEKVYEAYLEACHARDSWHRMYDTLRGAHDKLIRERDEAVNRLGYLLGQADAERDEAREAARLFWRNLSGHFCGAEEELAAKYPFLNDSPQIEVK